ncbi:MAG: hypothetical protein KC414_05990 [Romboutsia sp.]|nr:hypothetical protein [Romboutsia sp.]
MKTISDVEEFISYTKEDLFHPVQVDLFGNTLVKEFVEYLLFVADIHRIDELDCKTSFRRTESEKTLDFILPLLNKKNTLKAGIKINHLPKYHHLEWELWENGFIEGFVCFDRDPEYFIWTYIKMEHLPSILNKFKDNLIDYRL